MAEKGKTDHPALLHGKYELGRMLGHGTFAKVYHARHVTTGKSVAMKVVGKEKVIRVGMMEQIQREISVMNMVKHPNIVELHEVMASKSKIYFAMELVRGGELFSKVVQGRLKEDLARFATTRPASSVISRLEEVAKSVKFNVKKSESKVRLQGQECGRKGKLAIAADIFAVTPSFLVVEVKKDNGDTFEYNQFCSKQLRPALQDIVWTSPAEKPTVA
ncbi:hypothetical protein GOBAR_AA22492 [Gossypium barbadense]|uniref:non-specific serine/threonine protein kinase n=1 Tax=Gossypium barbadense TaxID=3634 RepID=A0A2P5X4B2_GOSBA|nr:hypothetical protein GOBAR_AA22492 [Gossypium barbadense]